MERESQSTVQGGRAKRSPEKATARGGSGTFLALRGLLGIHKSIRNQSGGPESGKKNDCLRMALHFPKTVVGGHKEKVKERTQSQKVFMLQGMAKW